jgi:hypothetical protein
MILLTILILAACVKYLLMVLARCSFAWPCRSPSRSLAHACFFGPYVIFQIVHGRAFHLRSGTLKGPIYVSECNSQSGYRSLQTVNLWLKMIKKKASGGMAKLWRKSRSRLTHLTIAVLCMKIEPRILRRIIWLSL